jgi:CDP-diacylglycerol--glycerol-3-phosphate 3-phosphatidyltransferase/cardiolipin synthase
MGHYRAADLLLLPSLVSMLRLPLAISFPFCVDRPALALAVLVVAGATDVIDGFIARKFDQATPTGAVIDPITDKLFVLVVVVTLVVEGRLAPFEIVLLSLRDIGELPLVVWWSLSPKRRRARAEQPVANVPGKLATAVQFAVVGSAIVGSSATSALVFAAGVTGTLAAAAYWWRELRRSSRTS